MSRAHRVLPALLGLLLALATLGACSSPQPVIATFSREWDDGRVETLELHDDGKVLMDHAGYIDRVTLAGADVDRLRASLADIAVATDPAAYPRLTLTPTGADPVIVDGAPGTAGELFLSLLDRHRLP